MIGSIIGDIAGSMHEFSGNKRYDVELFPREAEVTDDSILTLATCEALMTGRPYHHVYREFGNCYPEPMGGYGVRFNAWLHTPQAGPYNSWGNGSAMRVGPVGFAGSTLEDVLAEAERSAAVTHDHPEGIKGAQATAAAIFLARQGSTKDELKTFITNRFGYDLSRSVAQVRATYSFNESCAGTVPEALIAVLDANDFESAIRNAISMGGDADTVGCIAGGVAQALFKEIPTLFIEEAMKRLPPGLKPTAIMFMERFPG